MIFTNTISLVLALAPVTLFAAPTQVADSIANLIPRQDLPKSVIDQLKKTNGLCDLSKIVLPIAPTPLPAPASNVTLRHIAIGRGTQNYTCASSTADVAPVANGAIASLFNATCDSARLNDKVMADVTTLALNYAIPTGPEAAQRLSGHHEFTEKKVPFFKLQTANNDYGSVHAMPDIVKSVAPTDASKGSNGLGSVPWLKLNAVDGDYKEVYRVHTAGGVAPKTCEGLAGAFTVEYSAQYWFYA
ncbi:hypothetical protein FB567DRAFT_598040 [Paraphoma chrysanthemicola]|uniref:Malate dehydrogenase n=1 Tax=Paraphoma chrysanthemicola TaxID=798071 RepID=A0A8K0QV61_9PLEO|nr:hypothetical protein FB567DRAFT_598040 [Paraphoma chrysanthemicola]